MVLINVSIGELIDKISILEVKKRKVTNISKLHHIEKELKILSEVAVSYLTNSEIFECYKELIEINNQLWDIEDDIRSLEHAKQFDFEFISLARKVYITNDKRFLIKDKINNITDSQIKEIKDYKEYL